jgi:hypothetical protein
MGRKQMGEARRRKPHATLVGLHVYDLQAACGPGPEPWTSGACELFRQAAEGRWTCSACRAAYEGAAAWLVVIVEPIPEGRRLGLRICRDCLQRFDSVDAAVAELAATLGLTSIREGQA